MIDPKFFYSSLVSQGVEFFTGVPDSLLANLCSCIADMSLTHIPTVNEGSAVALASGYHLSTGKIGAVYMQNSGIGNAVNPLTSLTSKEVYNIPILLIIGWRGEPGTKDEPQHQLQGKITCEQLNVLNLPYEIVDYQSDYVTQIKRIIYIIKKSSSPAVLLIRSKTFSSYKQNVNLTINSMIREKALKRLLTLTDPRDIIISTTGKTSRELYELRNSRKEIQRDFLTVGSMGYSSSIALGVALSKPNRRIICLDGDGSFLMHMGVLAMIGALKPKNFIHVLLNNGVHESVGGQPTANPKLNIKEVILGCGYKEYYLAQDEESLTVLWNNLTQKRGPILFELKIAAGSRNDLGRPVNKPVENKQIFMKFVNDNNL